MTKRECAIIMAHTGACMLTGEDFKIFHSYIEDILKRPVFTHELGNPKLADEIKEKSTEDFLKLCRNAESEDE